MKVLITRPKDAAEKLARTLAAEHVESFILPVIEIQAIDDKRLLSNALKNLSNIDIAIFVSQSAVQHAVKDYLSAWDAYRGQLIAIGETTANYLKEFGLRNIVYPTFSNSESLLKLSELEYVRSKRIAIFSGLGGKTLIQETLSERGADVEKIICYQRCLPNLDSLLVKNVWSSIDIIIGSSGESLVNLITLLKPIVGKALFLKPLLVISENMLHLAQQLGFGDQVFLAQGASDRAIKEGLAQLSWLT